MELSVQSQLMTELIQLEAQRIAAEANIGLLEKTEKLELSPEQMVGLRREYVNSNPMVAELSKSIVAMEQDLIVAQQTHHAGDTRARPEPGDPGRPSRKAGRQAPGTGAGVSTAGWRAA